MNITTNFEDRGKLFAFLAMVVGLSMMFVGFLPIGYSGAGTTSVEILGYPIPTSAEIASALFYLIPVLGTVGIGLFLFGLMWAVRRSLETKRKYVGIAWALLAFGASLFILSGIILAFRDPSNTSPYVDYASYAEFGGLMLYALGVLFIAVSLPIKNPWERWIGCGLIGVGTIFSLASMPFYFGIIDSNLDDTISNLITAFLIFSVPLILLGVVWIEKSLVVSSGRMTGKLRLTMMISSITLLLGTVYLFLLYVQPIAIDAGSPLLWSPLFWVLTYCYYSGILLVCAITMVLFSRRMNMRAVKDPAMQWAVFQS